MKNTPTEKYAVIQKPVFGIHGPLEDDYIAMQGAHTTIHVKNLFFFHKATVETTHKHLPTLTKNGYGFNTTQAIRNALTPRAVTSLKTILYFIIASALLSQLDNLLRNELPAYINSGAYLGVLLITHFGGLYRGKP